VTNGIEVERREVQFAMRLVARRVVVGGGWLVGRRILLHIQLVSLSVDGKLVDLVEKHLISISVLNTKGTSIN